MRRRCKHSVNIYPWAGFSKADVVIDFLDNEGLICFNAIGFAIQIENFAVYFALT